MTYPEPINITGLVEMFKYANNVTKVGNSEGIFVIMLLITVYIVPLTYMLLKGHRYGAFLSAGFIVTITTVILRVAEITTVDKYLFFAIATILIPLVMIFLKE